MGSTSAPLICSPLPSSPAPKRSKPHDEPKPRARVKAGFLIDDDSDDDGDGDQVEPAAKRRMLSSPGRNPSTKESIPTLATPTPATQPQHQPQPHHESYGVSTTAIGFSALLEKHANITTTSAANNDRTLVTETSTQASTVDILDQSTGTFASAFQEILTRKSYNTLKIKTCKGTQVEIKERETASGTSYERLIAARSRTKEGRATKSYYGVDIHTLMDTANQEIKKTVVAAATATTAKEGKGDLTPDAPRPSVEGSGSKKAKKYLLWSEKYRARTFLDLCGDDGTNRQVLRWLKRWDPVVFPGSSKHRPSARRRGAAAQDEEEKPHRKILMLTGPPGLGKTTLAHVCARQAGYEVLEINASDDRSRDVVNNRIRTTLGTESVKTVQHHKTAEGQQAKIARPICVVVDEVDGVVTGSGGGGEGGFIKALIDLITIGEKNKSGETKTAQNRRRRKGDDFRQMRPLVLICNDVYHPSLRPLRQSNLAEIIHVGKPSVESVVARLKAVFEKEGIPCEKDAARKLCEAAWGLGTGLDARKGAESTTEGDLRGAMVVGEWVAGRFRSSCLTGPLQLTRHWVEQHVMQDLAHGGGGARGVGRGNVKDIVERIFFHGAGFPPNAAVVSNTAIAPLGEQPKAQLGFLEHQKKYAMERLQQMVETSGDIDRVMTDILSEYPNHDFNDDTLLSKPNDAYEWMHFHDRCASALYGSQSWELSPYLSQPVLACHHLFASPMRSTNRLYQKRGGDEDEPQLPFSGPRAGFLAHEAEKGNRAMLQVIQTNLSPALMRAFRNAEDIATDFVPYLIRLVSPDVKPVVVGGGGDQRGIASVRKDTEKAMVKRAANTLIDVGVNLQRGKLEDDPRGSTWVYRMEPDLDVLANFETSPAAIQGTQVPTRYAVRQVLDQELQKLKILRDNSARQARFQAGSSTGHGEPISLNAENHGIKSMSKTAASSTVPIKKDFFGRVIVAPIRLLEEVDENGQQRKRDGAGEDIGDSGKTNIWVSFHEGLNNAVRKPLGLDELLRGL